MTRAEWLQKVAEILQRDWCLSPEAAGWDDEQIDRYYSWGESPEEFVKWYADKYELLDFRDPITGRMM